MSLESFYAEHRIFCRILIVVGFLAVYGLIGKLAFWMYNYETKQQNQANR